MVHLGCRRDAPVVRVQQLLGQSPHYAKTNLLEVRGPRHVLLATMFTFI